MTLTAAQLDELELKLTHGYAVTPNTSLSPEVVRELCQRARQAVEWYDVATFVPPVTNPDGTERPFYVLVFNGHHTGVGYRSPRWSDDPNEPEWCEENGEYIQPPPTLWAYLPKPTPLSTAVEGDEGK